MLAFRLNRLPRISFALLIALITLAAMPCLADSVETPTPPPLPEQVDIYYFHETVCGSCDGAQEFYDLLNEVVEDKTVYPYKLHVVNVYEHGGMDAFNETLATFGHTTENLDFPVLMINSKLFSGLESIRNNLNEAYLTAGEDIFVNQYVYNKLYPLADPYSLYPINSGNATVFYFYRITCEECQATKPFIDALPAAVSVNGVETPLDVFRANTRSGDVRTMLYDLFEQYEVPDDDRMVPIVFFGDKYLTGKEAIESQLMEQLEAGND